jgi:hypothetical protein
LASGVPQSFELATDRESAEVLFAMPISPIVEVRCDFGHRSCAFAALKSFFRLRKDRMSSVIPLLVYFDRHGYLSPDPALYDGDFEMTSLEDHMHSLFAPSIG